MADELPASAKRLAESLALEGCVCEQVSGIEGALNAVRNLTCDVVVCDIRMAGSSDFELPAAIRALNPGLPIIIGSAQASVLEAVEALKQGAFQIVEKPFNVEKLLAMVGEAALRTRRPTQPPPKISGLFEGNLVQESVIMRELVESIALVARSSAPVLILGETGTGKERVARAVHAGGPRASRAFVAVNASAVPESLLESEVFGHTRGAFTGATHARRGLMLEADTGTLFLDEIGDMPIALQPKLLRVLQFGETRPVGSDRIRHVDVRIIDRLQRVA